MTDLTLAQVKSEFAIQIFDIAPTHSLIVGIRYNGSVKFGEGITPDAAAQEFYNRLATLIHQGASQ